MLCPVGICIWTLPPSRNLFTLCCVCTQKDDVRSHQEYVCRDHFIIIQPWSTNTWLFRWPFRWVSFFTTWAAAPGNMQAMQLLLDAGADVDFVKEGGFVAEGGRIFGGGFGCVVKRWWSWEMPCFVWDGKWWDKFKDMFFDVNNEV